MDRKRFEAELVELLAGEWAPGERRERLERLRQAAAGDPELEGCRELLELLALPEGQRDLVEMPGEEYWSGFNDRLQARIESAPPGRDLARWWPAAAAAVLLLGIAAWALTRGPAPPGPVISGDRPALETVTGGSALGDLPAFLAEQLRTAPPSELMAEIDFWVDPGVEWAGEPDAGVEATWVGPADPAGLFPDTADLAPEARRELLEWLKAQT